MICTGLPDSGARGIFADYPVCANPLQATCNNMNASYLSITVSITAATFRYCLTH